jgi:hypothetical protein
MSASTRPLVVGVVQHDPKADELRRSKQRVALALYARRAGFALHETFELYGDQDRDTPVISDLGEVIAALPITTVLVCGPVETDRLGLSNAQKAPESLRLLSLTQQDLQS